MTAIAAPNTPRWDGVRSAIELFVLERRAERRQPKTISDYRLHLGQFYNWLVQQDLSGDGPADVDKGVVLSYRLHMQERPRLDGRPGHLEHSTLVGSQRALRTFFGWAIDEGYPIDPRILKLRKRRIPQKDATVFTLSQVRTILSAAACENEKVAVSVLIGTGVRISEAIGVCLRGSSRSDTSIRHRRCSCVDRGRTELGELPPPSPYAPPVRPTPFRAFVPVGYRIRG